MTKILKTIANVALVIAGFFIVFFGYQRASKHSDNQATFTSIDGVGVVYADTPCGDSGGGGGSADPGVCECGDSG